MAKYRSGRITIDVSDCLDEIDDDDLLEEVHARKLNPASVASEQTDNEMVREAYAELLRGRPREAASILDRLLNPKWNTLKACETAAAERLKY